MLALSQSTTKSGMRRTLAILLALAASAAASPSGAPKAACGSFAPGHGGSAQSSASLPYFVRVTGGDYSDSMTVASGVEVTVILEKRSSSDPDFKGFLIRAVDTANNDAGIGEFTEIDSLGKSLSCGEGATVTHSSRDAKDSVRFKWRHTADGADASVRFVFTVVQDYSTYWVSESSDAITVKASADGAQPEPDETKTDAADPEAESAAGKEYQHADYAGCFETKGCFGVAEGCVDAGTCSIMVAYRPVSGDAKKFEMVLHGKDVADKTYLAVGFSKDAEMGDDLVISCIRGNNALVFGKNDHHNNEPFAEEHSFQVTGVTVTEADGYMTCTFTVDSVLEAEGLKFDLADGTNHLLVAKGKVDSSGNLGYHDEKLPSGSAVQLTQFGAVSGADNVFLRVHAALMVIAWTACVPSGIVIARYMKDSFWGKKVAGADLWFRLHQLNMVVGLTVTIVGFALAVVEKGFLRYSADFIRSNPHPALGMAVIVLGVAQPIMALFRCHPGTKFRWIFDWAHWLVGNSAFLVAVVAMFFAAKLASVDFIAADWLTGLLAVFVAVYVIVHILLSVQRLTATWKQKKSPRVGSAGSEGGTTATDGDKTGGVLAGASLRRAVTFAFLAFVWIFSLALAFVFGFGKK